MKNSEQPAFAYDEEHIYHENGTGVAHIIKSGGLTKLEYACIKLGIPETGDEELDRLILEAERKRLAELAMQGMLANPNVVDFGKDLSRQSVLYSDALLKQLEK